MSHPHRERHRARRGRRHRAGRGDIRAAILVLLGEEPMHGYQIMQELEDRSNGVWKPSPGSIYPTLQQLADEGLVTSDDAGGRKVFTLTDAGLAAGADAPAEPPWEELAGAASHTDLRRTAMSLMAASKQVGQVGTGEQVEAAAAILADARQQLYKLLAG